MFYIQQACGTYPKKTSKNRTSIEECNNHNATAEKRGLDDI